MLSVAEPVDLCASITLAMKSQVLAKFSEFVMCWIRVPSFPQGNFAPGIESSGRGIGKKTLHARSVPTSSARQSSFRTTGLPNACSFQVSHPPSSLLDSTVNYIVAPVVGHPVVIDRLP
jgi:hypothetical protein